MLSLGSGESRPPYKQLRQSKGSFIPTKTKKVRIPTDNVWGRKRGCLEAWKHAEVGPSYAISFLILMALTSYYEKPYTLHPSQSSHWQQGRSASSRRRRGHSTGNLGEAVPAAALGATCNLCTASESCLKGPNVRYLPQTMIANPNLGYPTCPILVRPWGMVAEEECGLVAGSCMGMAVIGNGLLRRFLSSCRCAKMSSTLLTPL